MSCAATLRIKSRQGCIFEADAQAMHLSTLIRELHEDCSAEEEVLIPLPLVGSTTLAKIIDYCKHHEGRAPNRLPDRLKSGDLTKSGASPRECQLVDLPTKEFFELLDAATILNIEPLMDLMLAKLATLMMVPGIPASTALSHNLDSTAASVAPLIAMVRQRCGCMAPCDGARFSHPKERPCERRVEAAAVKKLYSERFETGGRYNLLTHAFVALDLSRTQTQAWVQALDGEAPSLRASGLLSRTCGSCFDAVFLARIARLPRFFQRRIEAFIGSDMLKLLSDAHALAKSFGLGSLAGELGAALAMIIDVWQADVQKLGQLKPRVLKYRGHRTVAEDLQLHPDGCFVRRTCHHEGHSGGGPCTSTKGVERGMWYIQRHPGVVECDRSGLVLCEPFVEGTLILRRVVSTEGVGPKPQSTPQHGQAVVHCVGRRELLDWAEERQGRDALPGLKVSYMSDFEGAIRACVDT